MLFSVLTNHVFRCFSCNRGLLLKHSYLLRALVYAPSPPVCHIHVSEYICVCLFQQQQKVNAIQANRRGTVCVYTTKKRDQSLLDSLLRIYSLRSSRSSTPSDFHIYHVHLLILCILYQQMVAEEFCSFSARKVDLLMETHNQE